MGYVMKPPPRYTGESFEDYKARPEVQAWRRDVEREIDRGRKILAVIWVLLVITVVIASIRFLSGSV